MVGLATLLCSLMCSKSARCSSAEPPLTAQRVACTLEMVLNHRGLASALASIITFG